MVDILARHPTLKLCADYSHFCVVAEAEPGERAAAAAAAAAKDRVWLPAHHHWLLCWRPLYVLIGRRAGAGEGHRRHLARRAPRPRAHGLRGGPPSPRRPRQVVQGNVRGPQAVVDGHLRRPCQCRQGGVRDHHAGARPRGALAARFLWLQRSRVLLFWGAPAATDAPLRIGIRFCSPTSGRTRRTTAS